MSEPFENKYRQLRMRFTEQKVRMDELRTLLEKKTAENQDFYFQLRLANAALIQAGYRRLEDMSWTDEPYPSSEEVAE